MEIRLFLNIIFRFKHIIVPMCLSAIVTATLLTYVLSEKYQSSTTVLIRPQQTLEFVSKREEILDFPVSYFTPVDTASKTYTEIIKSRTIAERVVQQLGLDTLQEAEGSGLAYYWKKAKKAVKELILKTWILLKHGRIEPSDPHEAAVAEVQGGLSVEPTKETYLFELQAEAKSPIVAAAVADAATQAFAEYLSELNADKNSNSRQLSRERLEFSRKKLNESRRALVEFKKERGIVAIREEMALDLEALVELEKSWESINTRLIGLDAEKREIERQIADLKRFAQSATKITDNPLRRELNSNLAHLEVKLAGLRSRYSDEHGDVQSILAEIDEIKARLADAAPTLESEATMSVDPVFEELHSDLARVETGSGALRAERVSVTAAIEEKKRAIEQMPGVEAELSTLELAKSLDEETHKLLLREYEELQLAADKSAIDITVIHAAAVPVYPVRPIKIYHAGLAGILSLLTGIAIALLIENMNTAVRSIHEAEQRLELPVLMTIPRLDASPGGPLRLIGSDRKMLFAENRRLERVCVQYPVEIKRLGDSLTGHGVVSDLSSSGISCYVESKLNLRSDDEVEISIFMNDTPDRQAVLRGVVLRSKAAIAGYHFSTTAIRFTSASDALSERVRAIVQATAGAPSFALPPHFKEPIRGLRSDILFMSNQGMSSFLMTSCGPQEGKSTIVCNLAIAIAEINKRVVVVDANLRSPTVHEIMNLPNERGLSNVLLESTDPYVAKTKSGVSVLTSGTPVPDPSALLGSYEMIRLVKFLDDGFDFVLFDSPPLLAGPDSALLASLAHGVIIVLNAGGTTVDDLRRGKQILDRSNAKTLGIVMNNFEDESASYYAWSSDYGKKSS